MTPDQALQILDQATAALSVNRQTHNQIMQALAALRQALPRQTPLANVETDDGSKN